MLMQQEMVRAFKQPHVNAVDISRKVKSLCGCLLLMLLLAGCGSNTTSDLAASARFEKPADWTWVAGATESDHPVAVGPGVIRRDFEREDEVFPNINLREVSFDGGPERMADWIRRNIEFTTNTFSITKANNTIASEPSAFKPDEGTHGTRVVLENRRFHRPLVHIQYYFLREETIHILTFTRPESEQKQDEKLDRLADQAARSFK